MAVLVQVPLLYCIVIGGAKSVAYRIDQKEYRNMGAL